MEGKNAELQRQAKYQSLFDQKSPYVPQKPQFFPPEALGSPRAGEQEASEEAELDISSLDSWDLATRYHEFKARKYSKKITQQLRRLSAHAILQRAQTILGSIVHPMSLKISTIQEIPSQAEQIELDLEETLENSPVAVQSLLSDRWDQFCFTGNDIWMNYQVHRPQAVILSVDTSLSMTGEKLALTAVALVVVLLEFYEDSIGIVAFENEAKVIKSPDEKISIQNLVERFLDVPAQGYTHLEEGMKVSLQLLRKKAINSGQSQMPSVVLLTDGKYTAGRDPSYLASQFPHLIVLKMGREKASYELCRELAKRGKGVMREVDELESLPTIMYGVVKDLLRGRSMI